MNVDVEWWSLSMPSTRNIIRVFLASPGDLSEERKLAKIIADEFNANNADYLGYQVELLGWEDTVSQQGRAQGIINRDLLKCDLFIGLMWKRWGTPPSNGGPYTSGFEEEYHLAKNSLQSSGRPDMKLYFRTIEQEARLDPGEGLKKVIEFQDNITKAREIYYETFSSIDEFRRRFTRAITLYIHELNERNREKSVDDSADQAPVLSIEHQPDSRPRGAEAGFLDDLSKTLASESSTPDAVSVARLRTLAAAIPQSGNDQQYVGVHDSNLIFGARKELSLSNSEIRTLVDTALSHIANQYVPLYYWLVELGRDAIEYLTITTWVGPTDSERIGALRVLKWLASPLHAEHATPVYWDAMFSDETSTAVKKALLEYLEVMGTSDHLPAITQELEKSNYGTLGAALRTAAILMSRSSVVSATEFIVGQQFQNLERTVADQVLVDSAKASHDLLQRAILHSSPTVRRWALDGMRRQNLLTNQNIESLLGDSDADIRWIALQASIATGTKYSDEEAKGILVRNSNSQGIGIGIGSSRDTSGEENFESYRRHQAFLALTNKPDAVPIFFTFDSSYKYFAVVDKYFSSFGRDLEAAVEDRFVTKYQQIVARIEDVVASGAPQTLIDDYRNLSSFVRKQWLRTAIEILQRRGGKEQLSRIRSAVSDEFYDPQVNDIEYIGKYGDRSDIDLVLSMGSKRSMNWYMTIGENNRERATARSVYRLAKGNLDALIDQSIKPNVFREIVKYSTIEERKSLADKLVNTALLDEDDDLRATVSAALITSLPQKKIKSILHYYESLDRKRFYNVIHWLDLGVSWNYAEAKKIASRALAEL